MNVDLNLTVTLSTEGLDIVNEENNSKAQTFSILTIIFDSKIFVYFK